MLALAVLATSVAACGNDPPDSRVVVTTGVVRSIVAAVAGPDLEVAQLIPDGVSPHSFSPSARDRRRIEEAELLVRVSPSIESAVRSGARETLTLADHAGRLRSLEGGHAEEEGGHAGEDEEEHSGLDPHVWMDPTRIAHAAPAIGEALAEADPGAAEGYRARARALARRLLGLDRELRGLLRAVPASDRTLVTSHDSLGYFADRYGFEVVGTVFPASGPEAEPSAGRVRDLIASVRRAAVPAVFAQHGDDARVLRRVAETTGVRVVDDLLVESLGDARDYPDMLRRDARLIAAALR